MDWTQLIGTFVTAAVTLMVCIITQNASQKKIEALIQYRLEQLEKKVEKHNNLIDRTYKLEEDSKIQEEKIKVANHRIDDLERKVQ